MTILHTSLFGDGRGDLERPLRCTSYEGYRIALPGGCFIPVRGEFVRTPSLTFVVPWDMAETYGGCGTATAWGEGMARRATLMGVGPGNTRTSTLDNRLAADLIPRANVASSEVLSWLPIWRGLR
ncbi:hypothetical protein BHE74_00043358 [Ensete ventricosum]|nr:hypothetical protein BHE74_00043358 [Ensete ventricosum]